MGHVQDRPRGEPSVVDNMGVLEGAGGLPLYVGLCGDINLMLTRLLILTGVCPP